MNEDRFKHEALLQEKINGKVRCNVCERRCVITPAGLGWCQTRTNQDGKLISLIYGAVSSLAANPIEKKPLYHFFPGSYAMTAGSWSCNFACPWCQNWHISKKVAPFQGDFVSPERFLQLTKKAGCQGTSISFNEPTLSLEWSLEVFRLARQGGLYNTYITNGYMTPEALQLLVNAGLDAMNVDIKGDLAFVRKYCKGIDVNKVWQICQIARTNAIHVEITTLVIPGLNDSQESLYSIASRIVSDLGADVPWHISAYYPAYRFTTPPTPIQTLERAWQIGKEVGLQYVYLGNVPGHAYDNTKCPACGTLLIQRLGFKVLRNEMIDGCCPQCGRVIPGVWEMRGK